MVKYWQRVIRRAAIETVYIIFHGWRKLAIEVFCFAIAVWILGRFGLTDLGLEHLKWEAAVLSAAAILFLPIFIWRLLAVPVAIERELAKDFAQREDKFAEADRERVANEDRLAKEVAAQATQLERRRDFNEVRDSLGRLLDEGNNLLHHRAVDESNYEKWKSDVNAWYNRVNGFLIGRVSSADAAMFRDVSGGLTFGVQSVNAEHSILINHLMKLIGNLNRVIDRYIITPH